MKNILHDKPDSALNARLTESIRFVDEQDVNGRRILDIGCGYGWFELDALKRGAKRIDGIEITETDLATAKEYFKDDRAVFSVAGALQLPFPDDTFDTVVSWEVIEHIPKNSEPQMFNEVARVLKPGGHFYLSTPFDSASSKLLDPAWWVIGHRHYSSAALEKFGKEAGMKVLSVNLKGKYWSLFSALNMYFSKWVLRRGPILAEYFQTHEFKEYQAKTGIASIFIKYEVSK